MTKNRETWILAKTVVNKEIIEIESDTDEVDGKMLALCGEVNASGDDSLATGSESNRNRKQIVCADGNTNRNNMQIVCAEGNTNRNNMQIVCADDFDSGLKDLEYKMYLNVAQFSEIRNQYVLDENAGDISPLRIVYNVDDEASDRSKGRAVKPKKSKAGRKAKSPMVSSVSKRLKTENGRAHHRSNARSVLRTNETQQKKGDGRRGRKSNVAKSSIEVKPTSNVRGYQEKNRDVRRGRKSNVSKSSIELKPTSNVRCYQEKNRDVEHRRKNSAKKDVKLNHTRNDKSLVIFRAPKRIKTEIGRADHNCISKSIAVANTKDTQRKKREALEGKKILVTKHNNELKSSGHVKDKLFHSFKPPKKENEESLSSKDKSYSHYCAYLTNFITNGKRNRQVKHVKATVCFSDPDFIEVSDHPFQYSGQSPFEANKDSKVHDLEEDIVPDHIFNSLFSKKLMEILRNPYDEKEFLRLYNDASHKRPATRRRELRDGREIEYDVHHKLAPSYLEQHPDFNKKYHRCRKDPPRALNLLRGFFFYLKHITLEGSFKPWMHETRLANLCANAKECKDIIVAKKSKRHRTALKIH